MAARAAGARRTIAIDIAESKFTLARDLGVHEIYNAADRDCVNKVRPSTNGGVHIARETAGVTKAFGTASRITRRGGFTVTAGLPGPDAKITLRRQECATEERQLKGSYMVSCVPIRDIPRYMGLFKDGRLPANSLMSSSITLYELNEGFDRLADVSKIREVVIL